MVAFPTPHLFDAPVIFSVADLPLQ